MKKTKTRRRTVQLTEEQMQQLRKDRELIAQELPDLIAKHQRICDAKEEPTMSGALRRAIHSSKILLDDLADRAGTDLDTLDDFLTGEQPLSSEIIDQLTKILKLKLEPANGKPKPRRAKAS
jgi:hypothetical protein